MSTEQENQIPISPPIPPPTVAIPPPQENTLICAICEANIANSDERLVCANKSCGKLTCVTCANTMIDMLFAQPTLNYPLQCGLCQEKFDRTHIEDLIIKHGHYEQYIACVLPLYWSKECLAEHEQLAQCPFCPYLEIHTTDACSIDFFTCQHPACSKRSCLICLHAIEDENDELTHKNRCLELRSCKQLIEQAIEAGSLRNCPHCQLTGIKDDNCTHMVCERCQYSWCYFCGMKEEECSVDDYETPTLSAHNQGWESNENRCPMSLVSIHEIDQRWPHSDQDCLEYFHRYRTLCQLYDVLKTVGEDKLNELNHCFGTIDVSGYTIDEIKDYESRILIKYSSEDE